MANVVRHVPTVAFRSNSNISITVHISLVNEESPLSCWQLAPVPIAYYVIPAVRNAVVVYLYSVSCTQRITICVVVSILVLLNVNQFQLTVSASSDGDRYMSLLSICRWRTCVSIYNLVIDVYATLDIPVVSL